MYRILTWQWFLHYTRYCQLAPGSLFHTVNHVFCWLAVSGAVLAIPALAGHFQQQFALVSVKSKLFFLIFKQKRNEIGKRLWVQNISLLSFHL